MNLKYVKQLGTGVAFMWLLSACTLMQPYQHPTVRTNNLYRDVNPTDTTSIGAISWSQMFSDVPLQNLLQEGIANNYDLKVALARLQQAGANYQQSRAALAPSVSVGPQVTQQKLSQTQGGEIFPYDRLYQLSASASWEVDVWGKLRSTKKAALAGLMQSDAYRRAVQTQLVADIAIQYYSLLAYDQQLKITYETLENRQQDVLTNKALKKPGGLPKRRWRKAKQTATPPKF